MNTDTYIPPTTARAAIAKIDRRLTSLVGAPGSHGNAEEVEYLKRARAKWADEAAAIQSGRIDHHRRLYTAHGEIAAKHYQTVVDLLREAHADRQGKGGDATAT